MTQSERELHRWILLFAILSVTTLVAIQVCNNIGVGHKWPFFVIVPLMMATIASAVVIVVKGNRRG